MSVITDNLGGTDAVDGDILYAANLVDTFNAATIHKKIFSTATEQTHTGDTNFASSGTSFSFTAPINSVILSVMFTCSLRISNGTYNGYANIKVSGTNLGTKYYSYAYSRYTGGAVDSTRGIFCDTNNELIDSGETSYAVFGQLLEGFQVLDTTTTFDIQIKTTNASATVLIKDVVLTIIYATSYKED